MMIGWAAPTAPRLFLSAAAPREAPSLGAGLTGFLGEVLVFNRSLATHERSTAPGQMASTGREGPGREGPAHCLQHEYRVRKF